MTTRYRVAGDHPVDIASGATFAPGERALGVDASHHHDAALIEAGRLVEIKPRQSKPSKPASSSENKEASK